VTDNGFDACLPPIALLLRYARKPGLTLRLAGLIGIRTVKRDLIEICGSGTDAGAGSFAFD